MGWVSNGRERLSCDSEMVKSAPRIKCGVRRWARDPSTRESQQPSPVVTCICLFCVFSSIASMNKRLGKRNLGTTSTLHCTMCRLAGVLTGSNRPIHKAKLDRAEQPMLWAVSSVFRPKSRA